MIQIRIPARLYSAFRPGFDLGAQSGMFDDSVLARVKLALDSAEAAAAPDQPITVSLAGAEEVWVMNFCWEDGVEYIPLESWAALSCLLREALLRAPS